VTSITLDQTIGSADNPYFAPVWAGSLLNAYANLESLTITGEICFGRVFIASRLPKLTHLVIRESIMPTPVLNKFLFRHAKALRSIIMKWVYLMDFMSLSVSWHNIEDPDDDDSEPKYTAPEDDFWFPIFEQLATMTKLEEVRFYDLSHDNFDVQAGRSGFADT
jgi:hypothetical protein